MAHLDFLKADFVYQMTRGEKIRTVAGFQNLVNDVKDWLGFANKLDNGLELSHEITAIRSLSRRETRRLGVLCRWTLKNKSRRL